MYFWNLKRAKEQILNEEMTDRKLLPYVIALTILISGLYALRLDYNNWDHVSDIVSLVIGGPATYYLFLCNRKNAEGSFLMNYLIIGWICSIRFLAAMFLLMLAIFLMDYFFELLSEEASLVDVVFFAVMEITSYLYIGHHLIALGNSNHLMADGSKM